MYIIAFDTLFETVRFPSGERHVRIRLTELEKIQHALHLKIVHYNCCTLEDLFDAAVANNALYKHRLSPHRVSWVIPYLPCARMDRRESAEDGMHLPIALRLAHDLMDNCSIIDPHSSLAGTLPHDHQAEVVKTALALYPELRGATFVVPDAGAAKKAEKWLVGHKPIFFTKTRNPRTGELSGFKGSPSINSDHYLIVDDICDGGGTFAAIAKELRLWHAPLSGDFKISLLVTHGLFTKGLPIPGIDAVYTLDTLGNQERWEGIGSFIAPKLIPVRTVLEQGKTI